MAKGKMTDEEIKKHNNDPNLLIKHEGHNFRCNCGCNVFHHKDNWYFIYCNSCGTEYECTERQGKDNG